MNCCGQKIDTPFVAVKKITIDPEGYVILRFDEQDARDLCLVRCVPSGKPFRLVRFGGDSPPYNLTIKLSDFSSPFDIAAGMGPSES